MTTPASLHNPYFAHNPSKKDVWTLINETAAAAQKELGKPVVNLGQGFFSYNPPQFVLDALSNASSKPQFNQYAPARGNPALLAELANLYSTRYGRPVTTGHVQVTTGANEGLLSIFFGFLTPGDEAIVLEPFFDQYISNIEMTGATVRYVPLEAPSNFATGNSSGDDWHVDWDKLDAVVSSKTKILVLNTPHNPLGKVFSEQELIRIGEWAVKNNIIVVSDEVYENLYYTADFPRPATVDVPGLSERVLTVGSAGKSFAATGWRVGWVEGPPELIKFVTAAHTRICFSSPAPLQQAVADGLALTRKNGYFEQTRDEYAQKYRIFQLVFDDLGLPYTAAQGGYFLLVNLAKLKIPPDYKYPSDIAARGTNDYKLAYWLIKEIGVVGIPPTEFILPAHRQNNPLENSIRFAVCKEDSVLEDAVKRLRSLSRYL